jgi:uncharacterized sulfatase
LAGAGAPTAFRLSTTDPNASDGISYLPTLLGQPEDQQNHEYLYWASQEGDTSVGVRLDNWKLVKYREPKDSANATRGKNPSGDWRLYDLTLDIGEEKDVAAQHPQIVARILELLERDGLL